MGRKLSIIPAYLIFACICDARYECDILVLSSRSVDPWEVVKVLI